MAMYQAFYQKLLTNLDNRFTVLASMPASLIKSLRGIGLSISESVVLGILLKGGPMFASRIAKEAHLNRTTTYGVLKELVEKGLVSKVKARSATNYQALSPELLPDYIAKRREDLLEKEKELRAAIPQLLLLRSKAHVLPKVQFFEGEEGVKQAYEDTLENNSEKFLRDISGVDAIYNTFDPVWIKYYLEKRTRLGIRCSDLAPESDWARKSKGEDEKYLRTTKFLPSQYFFDVEFAIYSDKVGIFSYAKENPVAILIEDATISHAMKQLFDFIESRAQ